MIGLARRHWPSMMLYRHWPFVGVQLFTPAVSHGHFTHFGVFMCLFSSFGFFFFFFFFCLQGGNAFADKVGRLLDPELRRLASCLPARAVEAKLLLPQSGIQGLFRSSENGLPVIVRLLLYHQMTFQLLYIWNFCSKVIVQFLL